MKKPLLIYGAGGLGREVVSLIRATAEWEPAGFVDDFAERNSLISGVRVIGGMDVIPFVTEMHIVIAVGDPVLKSRIRKQIKSPSLSYPVLIHPSAVLQSAESIRIGEGTIIGAGAILTTDIELGRHTLINLNVTIGHNCSIGDYCSLMPGVNVAGGVSVRESVLIGAGASILNGLTIGARSKVGMGAAVIDPVDDDVTVVGVPAKPVKK